MESPLSGRVTMALPWSHVRTVRCSDRASDSTIKASFISHAREGAEPMREGGVTTADERALVCDRCKILERAKR